MRRDGNGTAGLVEVNVLGLLHVIESEELSFLLAKLVFIVIGRAAVLLAVGSTGIVPLVDLLLLLSQEINGLVEERVEMLHLLTVDDRRALNQERSWGEGKVLRWVGSRAKGSMGKWVATFRKIKRFANSIE